MSNFRPFFEFCSDLSDFLHVTCNSIEKHCPVLFLPSAKNNGTDLLTTVSSSSTTLKINKASVFGYGGPGREYFTKNMQDVQTNISKFSAIHSCLAICYDLKTTIKSVLESGSVIFSVFCCLIVQTWH